MGDSFIGNYQCLFLKIIYCTIMKYVITSVVNNSYAIKIRLKVLFCFFAARCIKGSINKIF